MVGNMLGFIIVKTYRVELLLEIYRVIIELSCQDRKRVCVILQAQIFPRLTPESSNLAAEGSEGRTEVILTEKEIKRELIL